MLSRAMTDDLTPKVAGPVAWCTIAKSRYRSFKTTTQANRSV